MKSVLILAFATFFMSPAFAQDASPYTFEVVKELAKTSTKDQCNTGTCWSYATMSFVESELLRMGKGEYDLSEMYNVRVTYPAKADRYVRCQGKAQFSPGSVSHDVINAIAEHGMVPEQLYRGINYGGERHDHGEMDAMLEGMMKSLVETSKGSVSTQWDDAVEGVLDAYLGEKPKKFKYKNREYTPASFRDELGFVPADYVSITSFLHHPFNEEFVLEIPDNFSQGSYYNVTLNQLYDLVMKAVNSGYSVAWDADVSEKGFSFRNGMAILPADGVDKNTLFKSVVDEAKVTQESRQAAFDSYSTTDDHLMHITGIAKDQNGTSYFIIKNSWGSGNDLDGHQYISESYFKMKTIAVMVHKDALASDLRKNLGIR